jgi:hypothetical protein
MKLSHFTTISILTLALASACGGASEPAKGDKAAAKGAAGADAKDAKDAAPAVEVPTLKINEADWVEKNLKDVSPLINVTIKAPKDATFEKNGNGGVDIKLAGFYMLTVGNLAVSGIKEAIEWGNSSSIGDSSFKDGKKLLEEANGFVFTYQMKDEENGTKYAPESHFYYFIEKDGAVYSVNDTKPMDAFSTPAAAYTEALARQVYGLVKASAKAN